jgi:hypothetical protein
MSEKPIRRTQARVAERDRRRVQEERKERLKYLIPLAAGAILLALVVGYLVFPSLANPSQGAKGANGGHFQANTEKIDLGDQPLGQTVHASFDIQNTGDGTLTLTVPQIASVLEGC